MQSDNRAWAIEEFGDARLGDARRKWRLIEMATAVSAQPHGVIAAAFRCDADRQGAYDFLESTRVDAAAIEAAVGESCALRAAKKPFVFVPVDGTGISLSDPQELKELGPIGKHDLRGAGRGIKAISALALEPNGTPVGVAAQEFWTRPVRRGQTSQQRRSANRRRPRDERETQHWTAIITRVTARFAAVSANAWFVIDREGDARVIFDSLLSSGHLFTIRASHNRIVDAPRAERGHAWRPAFQRGRRARLRTVLSRGRPYANCDLEVTPGPNRLGRTAKLEVRIRRLSLRIRVGNGRRIDIIPMNVVWVREVGTTPCGEAPLDWMLLTNHPIDTLENVQLVIHSYTQRWRIEDFHKTWKSGACRVEQAQLRHENSLKKWATLLAAVAARIERLKHLARNEPDRPATDELTTYELKAVVLLKRREKKRTEIIDDQPTIALATRWIADLGGYTGKSSGGPPGSITIARGLERVRAAAAVIEELEAKRSDQG